MVLQLAGEGKLSLEDPVERWLPGMVPNGAAITLRMLLNHHSGLFDYFNDPQTLAPYLAGDFAHAWTPEQLVAIGVAHPPLFAPNASAAYSNTDYVLLGLVIPAVTGRSLEATSASSGRSSCATASPRLSSASPARTRRATCSPAPVTEEVPLDLIETRTFGSRVIYERYRRARDESD